MASNKSFKAEHGESFQADSITIMHGQGKIVLDFKKTAPRFDQMDGDSQHTIVTEHSPVVLSPRTAKVLYSMLEDNIETYEEKYGEIEMPDRNDPEEDEVDSHGYIG